MNFFRLLTPLLCLSLASCAQSQPAPSPVSAPKIPFRALIVSGGPSPEYNQYAIESNARYLEKLTARSRSQRVLFADGNPKSRTISALQNSPQDDARRVLAWLLDAEAPAEKLIYRASGLKRIDGAATAQSIAQNVQKLAREVKPGERALLYFTGHGSPGRKTRLSLSGVQTGDDFENTTYAGWNDGEFSVKDLSRALRDWPSKTPLVLVMVQCHAGGFANLIFEDANPRSAVLQRDFCGFFAATGERQASGCTSEVDEVDYQDFTTHFFAALSGVSRDGRRISGADFDKNGAVSLLEALAWTNVRDASIDGPLCTSEAYLRSIWDADVEPDWVKTPYSTLAQGAVPWQRAILDGLSLKLGLRGEDRVESALQKQKLAAQAAENDDADLPSSVDGTKVGQRFEALERDVKRRFPGLSAPEKSARFQAAQTDATRYLATRKGDLALLSGALKAWEAQSEAAATREAACFRFVRAARTLWLEKRLKTQGTAAQKAIFARIRAAESRNPLR